MQRKLKFKWAFAFVKEGALIGPKIKCPRVPVWVRGVQSPNRLLNLLKGISLTYWHTFFQAFILLSTENTKGIVLEQSLSSEHKCTIPYHKYTIPTTNNANQKIKDANQNTKYANIDLRCFVTKQSVVINLCPFWRTFYLKSKIALVHKKMSNMRYVQNCQDISKC